MKLSDIQPYITAQQELDSLCRVFLDWQTVWHKNKDHLHYIGHFIWQEQILVLYCTLNDDIPQFGYRLLDLKDIEGEDFESIKEKFRQMRLREYLNMDEGFGDISGVKINKGKSSVWKSHSTELFNTFFHFDLGGHTYDVYGFMNGISFSVNFQTDGDEYFSFRGGTADQRKLFGCILQCVKLINPKEVEFRTKNNVVARDKGGKVIMDGDTPKFERNRLKDFYGSKIFRDSIKKESDYEFDPPEHVDRLYTSWTYTKKKGA